MPPALEIRGWARREGLELRIGVNTGLALVMRRRAGASLRSRAQESGAERSRELGRVEAGDVAVVHPDDGVADNGRALPLIAEEASRREKADAQPLRRAGNRVVRRERRRGPCRRAARHRGMRREQARHGVEGHALRIADDDQWTESAQRPRAADQPGGRGSRVG